MILKISNLSLIYINYLTLVIVYLVQSKRPSSKHLLATWRLECDLGIITDSDCPIDGGWSAWQPWSPCHGACDNIGLRKRIRECNNPFPSRDGLPCSGMDEQIESCYLKNCSADDYRKIVEGNTARAEALHQLEAIPAIMERCLQMECPYEAIEAALASENTWQFNPEVLWNALQCVKHNLGCSVNGEWGTWATWSACGARCGKGLKWRIRRCDTPPPSAAHLVCSGSPMQYNECEGDQCAIDELPSQLSVSGSWSEWGQWTKCSEKCGTGFRRRKRTCIEKDTSKIAITWRTHCRGQYDELETCNNSECLLNGGWSGWGAWGQCSQTCGAGKRSRTRSCTRPIPTGGGDNCVGPKVEVGSCHLTPCDVFCHLVAVFNGDSVLHYNFPRKRSTFFHFFIRFMPLSPHGTLIRRGTFHNPEVRLSLHKWHICLDASGSLKTCSLLRTCSPSALEPSVWHSIMISVTNEGVTITLDDAQIPIQSSFPCDPEFINDQMIIFLGERLHGEIQELIINFTPVSIFIEREQRIKGTELFPTSASNLAYEKAYMEEAFINIENEQYLRVPCFEAEDEWQLELTIKSKGESGTILFLSNDDNSHLFYMVLQNMRIKIKLILDEFKSEAISSTECLPNQWLDLKLNKRKENTIEVSINSGERLHVLLTEDSFRKGRRSYNKYTKPSEKNKSYFSKAILNESHLNHNRKCQYINNTNQKALCNNEYFIGGIPLPIRHAISDHFAPFFGTIASLKINNNLLDLNSCNVERYKDEIIQLSARTASISGYYHETTWGESKILNLTCVHSRVSKSPYPAYWLYLDTLIEKNLSSMDNGRVLRLALSGNKDHPGFYTCRAVVNHRTRNVVTYGVLGQNHYKAFTPDTITIIAVCTTLSLVIFTLGWLIIEGYHDIHEGYGFFRDDHLLPEELSDDNDFNVQSNSENVYNVTIAKAKRKTKRLSGRVLDKSSLGVQQNNVEETKDSINEYTYNETDELPDLPEIKNRVPATSHQIYRCESTYFSSQLQGSDIISDITKLSSSSLDKSPRHLYSQLLMTKYKTHLEDNNSLKNSLDTRNREKLLTVKTSSFVNNSTIQKVLQKFNELKSTES